MFSKKQWTCVINSKVKTLSIKLSTIGILSNYQLFAGMMPLSRKFHKVNSFWKTGDIYLVGG